MSELNFFTAPNGDMLACDSDTGYTKSYVSAHNWQPPGGAVTAVHVGSDGNRVFMRCSNAEEAQAWLRAMHRFEPRRKK